MAKTEVQEGVVKKGSNVERRRIRGRNMFDVVNQLVTEYNSSNGWSVVNVSPTLLTFEVVLERSASQANEDNTVVANKVDSKGVTPDEEVEEKTSAETKDVLVEAGAEKQGAKTAKKTSATSAKKLTEAKKV